MTNTKAIEEFLQTAYTDERLAMLLAHAEDGKLGFYSCCCLTGAVSAPHAWTEAKSDNRYCRNPDGSDGDHYIFRLLVKGALAAESAFHELGYEESERRAAIIPLIKAEMARRDTEAHNAPERDSETLPDKVEGVLQHV